jgi:hypothetical protein
MFEGWAPLCGRNPESLLTLDRLPMRRKALLLAQSCSPENSFIWLPSRVG